MTQRAVWGVWMVHCTPHTLIMLLANSRIVFLKLFSWLHAQNWMHQELKDGNCVKGLPGEKRLRNDRAPRESVEMRDEEEKEEEDAMQFKIWLFFFCYFFHAHSFQGWKLVNRKRKIEYGKYILNQKHYIQVFICFYIIRLFFLYSTYVIYPIHTY